MLKKRLIPVLLLKDKRMVKGIEFDNYRDTGDPIFASKVYNSQYVDELIFLDINATNENRKTNINIIEQVSKVCFMPFSIGGGISEIDDIISLLYAGADKVVINSASYENYNLISEGAKIFGSQCIVTGIDVKFSGNEYVLYKNSGRIKCEIDLHTHIKNLENSGAGEIFINNISRDGKMEGYDIKLIKMVSETTNLPVIACGGAGNFKHLVDAFNETDVSALAMSSIFHFGDNNPIRARSFLKNNKIKIKEV